MEKGKGREVELQEGKVEREGWRLMKYEKNKTKK